MDIFSVKDLNKVDVFLCTGPFLVPRPREAERPVCLPPQEQICLHQGWTGMHSDHTTYVQGYFRRRSGGLRQCPLRAYTCIAIRSGRRDSYFSFNSKVGGYRDIMFCVVYEVWVASITYPPCRKKLFSNRSWTAICPSTLISCFAFS